jgi:NADPH:quinone reductase-like Zn-dependent oxidoreductase
VTTARVEPKLAALPEDHPTVPETMRAIPPHSPDLVPVTIRVPELEPDRILVEVRAASINPADYHSRKDSLLMKIMGRAFNGFKKPIALPAMGSDVAGVVAKLGPEATGFEVGDEVFGAGRGSLAEYASAKFLARKPAGLSFEQAASLNIAGVTALQGLRDKGGLKAGDKVLVNGAAGGVGIFAVQIAKATGAEVTAVCSGRNAELVRSVGADTVVDYTKEDFTARRDQYDVILDVVGNHRIKSLRGPLKKDGTLVMAGGGHQNGYQNVKILKPMLRMLGGAAIANRFGSQRIKVFIAQIKREDLAELARMANDGKLTPVISKSFDLDHVQDAFTYLETGHATGKIGVTVKA